MYVAVVDTIIKTTNIYPESKTVNLQIFLW